jgi:AraC-like DNA-binding protein
LFDPIEKEMQRNEIPKAYLYRQVVQAKLYIENNYNREINLDLISREASFSKFHFLRLFKKSFGMTPNQFLTEVRLENASKLLVKGVSVQDTCWLVGFDSMSSFSGLFKRRFGTSPTNYIQIRKKTKEKSMENPLKFIPGCFAENLGWEK